MTEKTMDLAIIQEFKALLEPLAHVHAMWIAGSVADGYEDEFSDIDLFLEIDDKTHAKTYKIIEDFLESKGSLDVKLGHSLQEPFTHRVYHIEGTNPYHFVEFTLHSRSDEYNPYAGNRHAVKVFDKVGFLDQEKSDTTVSKDELQTRKESLLDKIEVGYISVEKEVIRGNFTDALHNFEFWLRTPMIEIIRIKHTPQKTGFDLKHGSRDLPKDALDDIEKLCQIGSIETFRDKISLVKDLLKKYQ